LLTTSSDGTQSFAIVEFRYANSWSGAWTTERNVGVDGTIALVSGHDYDLTRTHFCWRKSDGTPMETDGFEKYDGISVLHNGVNQTDGTLVIDSVGLAGGAALGAVPASSCNSTVSLFPRTAAYERTWLALSSQYLFEQATAKLDDRRDVVERGTECAPESSETEIYELDCYLDAYASCRRTPSIPFRRVSQYEVRLKIDAASTTLAVRKREALSRLVGSNSVSDAVFFASVRLVVLLIVAFVVFNRAERASASAFSTMRAALKIAAGEDKHTSHTLFDAVSDAAVGALAIVSRALVLWHQSKVLVDDGSTDAVVWESIGVAVSTLHFLLRNVVLKTDLTREAPLSKLGGSMSLADASVAALVSVVQTPMLGASARDFDAVARLFCGVLISLFVFHRLLIAVVACAVLATTTASNGKFDRGYPAVLWSSCAMWILQTAAVAFAFSRLFVVPQSYSLVRVSLGNSGAVESAVFFAALSLSVPYLNSVAVRVVQLKL
jgi:hypothetical protein